MIVTLDYIQSDFWGLSRISSKWGSCYMVIFVDDFSKKVWVYILKVKDEAFVIFKQW